jgi:hypothetical protein
MHIVIQTIVDVKDGIWSNLLHVKGNIVCKKMCNFFKNGSLYIHTKGSQSQNAGVSIFSGMAILLRLQSHASA